MLKIKNCHIPKIGLMLFVVLAVTIGAIWTAQPKIEAQAVTTGNWSDYADDGWLDAAAERYSEYDANQPGSSQEYPYLIESAAEFAYLGVNGTTGELAGKYIKLSRGCNCDEPLTEIDFSAHYWDPVNLYGAEFGGMYDDGVSVYFDGNNVALTGVKINSYRQAHYMTVACEYSTYLPGCPAIYYYEHVPPPAPGDEANYLLENTGFSLGAGAAGLFGEIYKVRLDNFHLVGPTVQIEHPSGFFDKAETEDESIYTSTEDAVGTLVGSARRSRVLNSLVSNPDVDVTDGGWKSSAMVGGMIGHAAGYVYTINNRVEGGNVKLHLISATDLTNMPYASDLLTFGEYTAKYGGSYAEYFELADNLDGDSSVYYGAGGTTIALGGLIGMNYHSAVMNSSAETRLLYDLSNLSFNSANANKFPSYLECDDDDNSDPNCYADGIIDIFHRVHEMAHNVPEYLIEPSSDIEYGVTGTGIGGLIGVSTDTSAILACIMNSYAVAEIEITGQLVEDITSCYGDWENGEQCITNYDTEYMNYGGAAIGGLAGYVNDTVVNSYAVLNIDIAKDDGSYAAIEDWNDYPGYMGIDSPIDENGAIGEVFGIAEAENLICNEGCGEWQDSDGDWHYWSSKPDQDIYWDDPNFYPITDNYYRLGSDYQGVGYVEDYPWRTVDDRDWVCDIDEPTDCYWDEIGEIDYHFTETYGSGAELLAKLNAGLGDVAKVVRGHLVDSNMLAPNMAEWFVDHVSPWVLGDDGQPTLQSHSVYNDVPDNECSVTTKLQPVLPGAPAMPIVPGVPNTGINKP
jgi:hypothetical protein